jgi:cell division septation protein DedD
VERRPHKAAPRQRQATEEMTGAYALQFGAFTQEALARGLVRKLQANGIKAQMRPEKGKNGKVWHKVRSGGYATAQEAQQAARKLEHLGGAKPLVVRLR